MPRNWRPHSPRSPSAEWREPKRRAIPFLDECLRCEGALTALAVREYRCGQLTKHVASAVEHARRELIQEQQGSVRIDPAILWPSDPAVPLSAGVPQRP